MCEQETQRVLVHAEHVDMRINAAVPIANASQPIASCVGAAIMSRLVKINQD